MVVNDLKVSDGIACSRGGEMHLGFGFTGSFGVNGEVGRFGHFDACRQESKFKILRTTAGKL